MLNIQVISPIPGKSINADVNGVKLYINITVQCGAPYCAGGKPNTSDIDVTANIICGNMPEQCIKLSPARHASEFYGMLPIYDNGLYCIEISAIDKKNGMAGRTFTEIRIV